MSIEVSCFTRFESSIDEYHLPERFTYPFYYQPHPLCILAAEQLQRNLVNQQHWQHNFGLGDDTHLIIGKMFGVLLVTNAQGELGYISAFSGKLAELNHIQGFVPPVFDLLAEDGFFLAEQAVIYQVNDNIFELEKLPERLKLRSELNDLETEYDQQLSALRKELSDNKKQRKKKRTSLQEASVYTVKELGLGELAKQSVYDKWRLKDFTSNWQQTIEQVQVKLGVFEEQISLLKQQRKSLSANLQSRIFAQYQFLNNQQKQKSLADIFAATVYKIPPAGAGECAAPKLLQYAFLHDLTPISIAEFWWGASPKSEIKKHKQFYPACTGKCKPILQHMLHGIECDENPLLLNDAKDKELSIIYQDETILIVNKPAELLSVPGKEITDCVYQRIKLQFPEATGPLIVHRLDMATSGLMVLALTSQANKYLQKQFINREVEKEYVALVEGVIDEEQGEIDLPLRGDFYDRPKQIVCSEEGKPAKTYWQVLQRYPDQQQTKVSLKPHTGRTHQLRVHCAHAQGLNMPILGDDLYGKTANRLHLHAQTLTLTHPNSQKSMTFKVDAEF